ncbi:ISP domain-containing protein [Rhizoclosmatium globosum]|uniref:ISP domain-containing protein n=1 Tax=Rhizoclosmatium globosum TaxID=329046 RepID=A0A1Y2CVG6_9FUNG|nr:ISP domain-containing protein [Rhizoclosmatium globosum]|eukprot:ORY51021.1 ISP domain-containing protein [Rhizoclosmatium globosum]
MTIRTQEELEEEYYSESNTDMRNHWYPLLESSALPKGKPIGQHIFGDPIVMYRDPATNEPVALVDKCPHRDVPLSVGRIMDGKLECRFHGWQFETNGVCSKVPSQSRIPGNAKFDGFIWIWPGDKDRAAVSPKPSWYFQEDRPWIHRVGMTSLDIDAFLMNENFLDPVHLNFTHDSTVGKRENATATTISCDFIDRKAEGRGIGIAGKVSTPDRPDLRKQIIHFMPPCIVSVTVVDRFDQTFYCVPTRKGHCNFVYIIMEDYEMLKGLQERLAEGASGMNSPIAADLMIRTFRNWRKKVNGRQDGGPWFKGFSEDMEDLLLEGTHRQVGGGGKGKL